MSKVWKRFGLAALALVVLLVTVVALIAVLQPAPPPIAAKYKLPPGVDAWDAGRTAYDERDYERAVAYWRQLDPSHPQYARSLRYVGWEVYAEKLDEPAKGLRYVHRSVLTEPLSENTWQDLGRTYASLFGF